MRKFQVHQDAALQQSAKLKMWMTVTILCTVLISAAAVTYLHLIYLMYKGSANDPETNQWLGITFIASAVITATIVLIGTIIKQHQLGEGGKVIANDLGGQLLEEPRDADERRLVNIVEEMSIASGIPAPPIYFFETESINAFVAGNDPTDGVLGITRGAVRHLKRDELQGVIAHEFSHILNGDMKLNMQLAGWMHGVLAIRIVAGEFIEMGTHIPRNAGSFSRGGGGGGAAIRVAMIAIGVALYPIGLIGAFLSALVKAAMNRQREFLADAYAVEFTRNPQGLADAMKRMAGHQAGSRINSPRAIEASHMFFAEGAGRLASKMASHPPLVHRILTLTPDWDGVPLFPADDEIKDYGGAFQGAMSLVSAKPNAMPAEPTDDFAAPATYIPELAATMAFVGSVMQGIPKPIVQIAESEGGTSLVLCGLWLAHCEDRDATEKLMEETLSENDTIRIKQLAQALHTLDAAAQLLVFDTAVKRLEECESSELAMLRAGATQLMQREDPGNRFHWMWTVVLQDALDLREPVKPRYGNLKQIAPACGVVLAQVCDDGDNGGLAGFSFQRGLANLGLDGIVWKDEAKHSWATFEQALDMVAELAPAPRRQVALACSSIIASDREVIDEEAYLMRGICQRLGYEMPCLVPGQPILPGT